VAALEDVQLRVRDKPVHQPRVGQRDDRVIVPGQHERPLPQQRQERHAGPARAGGELIDVAPRRADPVVPGQHRGDALRIRPGSAPVQLACHARKESGVGISAGRDHLGEHGRLGWHHERAGSGADQHEAPAPVPLREGELLRHTAAPRDAEHVRAGVTQLGQQPAEQPAQASEPVRAGRHRRPAGSRHVEPDDIDRRVERFDERVKQLKAGPDPVDQQQRDGTGPGCASTGWAALYAGKWVP
jgi:hypothetical protein